VERVPSLPGAPADVWRWYAEQESERNMTAQNIADLVEVNIR
jgi:hypothetical protein